jgi:hypothetical protein
MPSDRILCTATVTGTLTAVVAVGLTVATVGVFAALAATAAYAGSSPAVAPVVAPVHVAPLVTPAHPFASAPPKHAPPKYGLPGAPLFGSIRTAPPASLPVTVQPRPSSATPSAPGATNVSAPSTIAAASTRAASPASSTRAASIASPVTPTLQVVEVCDVFGVGTVYVEATREIVRPIAGTAYEVVGERASPMDPAACTEELVLAHQRLCVGRDGRLSDREGVGPPPPMGSCHSAVR